MNPPPARLLVITDRRQARHPLEDIVASCLEGGARWILFRDKETAPADRRATAGWLARLVRQHPGARLSVSADIDLAVAVGAEGVHLQSSHAVAAARTRLGPGALIGLSVHRPDEVAAAAEAGADYVALSPIFPTRSKPGYGPALGPAALTEAAGQGLPVLALGGITPENAAACLAAGAAGIAVMGEAMRSEEPAELVRNLLTALPVLDAAS